ncbi:MAG: putative Ig domain-containing protein [Acidobacteria bacterium]|nr:putative Ig domain-containing protein [Acidobacteriota bacterium]
MSLGTLAGGLVVTPTTASLTTANQTAGVTFMVNATTGCAGGTAGTNNVTFRFAYGSGATPGQTITIAYTVAAATSPLTPTPTSLALTCVLSGGSYTLGTAQTTSIASAVPAANGGTPFTIDTSGNASGTGAAWATVTSLVARNADATTPASISVVPTAGCGGFVLGTTNSTTVTLLNTPAPNRVIPVTLRIVGPTPLTALPTSAAMTYVKGSGTAGKVDVLIGASSGTPFFTVDTTTLPIWLTVDSVNGSAPRSLRFSSTTVADTLAAGTYSATVRLRVANFGDLSLPVSLSVNNPAPKLTVSEGTTRNINWVVGQPLPTMLITAVSSDSPIPYTLVTGGKLAPIVAASQLSGLAYSFGTPIPVTFDQLLFASAVPGNVLTGTATLTWGSPAQTIVVTINVNVQSAGATVSGVSPASLPTAASGTTFTAVLTGSGFITGTDPALRTKVGIVSSGSLVTNTNITSTVINGSNIILTIIVPAVADTALPFSPTGTGGSVVIGICNPINGACSTPTGQATLSIGNNPIVQAVTSASAYLQVNPPSLQTIAPYDMISIFGTNFCTSGGTGCSSSQVLYGAADAATLTYPRMISPDAPGSTQRNLVVTFQTQATTPVVIATAPILFATNNQINAMVPAALSSNIGNVDMVVSFGYGTGATQRVGAPFAVTIAATNPGMFTVGSNGQGDGAVLDSKWAVVTQANPAAVRTNAGAVGSGTTAGTSDTIQLYLTGLGAPSAGANNASTGTAGNPTWGTDCVSTSSYLTSLNAAASSSLLSIDGAIMQTALLNTDRLVPCITPAIGGGAAATNLPTVTIGGRAAAVTYAGFVPDGIAGLYQINAKLPVNGAAAFTNTAGTSIATLTAPVQLPVVVTANSRSSQSGVSIWVTPRLRVRPPTALSGTVGVAWASTNNVVLATEGASSNYTFALTSGLLPAGITLNTSTGAISGTPAANTSGTYQATVTATDSAPVPLTGSVSFTVTVAGGLFLSSTGTSPFTGTFGTANATVTTVTATGGLFPYTYAITTPSSLPTGMTVGASSGVVGITGLTPAGVYSITVTGTDATTASPVTGATSFSLDHALLMTPTNPLTPATGVAGPVRTITATGGTGTITYATATAGFTVNSSTGVVSSASGTAAGTYSVVVTATDGTVAPGATGAATGTITISATVTP